jgi:hypothetical protein
MTAADLEALLRITLPPLKLGLHVRDLEACRQDPAAACVAERGA